MVIVVQQRVCNFVVVVVGDRIKHLLQAICVGVGGIPLFSNHDDFQEVFAE